MTKGKFKVDIYGFTVEIVVVSTIHDTAKFYEKLLKKLKLQDDSDVGPWEGVVFQHNFTCWIILCEDRLSYDTITHEVSHLTDKILNYNNIEHGQDNENKALLNGFLNGKVFNFLITKGYKIIDSYGKEERKRNSS